GRWGTPARQPVPVARCEGPGAEPPLSSGGRPTTPSRATSRATTCQVVPAPANYHCREGSTPVSLGSPDGPDLLTRRIGRVGPNAVPDGPSSPDSASGGKTSPLRRPCAAGAGLAWEDPSMSTRNGATEKLSTQQMPGPLLRLSTSIPNSDIHPGIR